MGRRAGVAMPALVSLLIAAAPAPAPVRSVPSLADARDVMRVVLAFETQMHRQAEVGPPPCVRQRIAATSLGGNRGAVEAFERPPEPRRRPSVPVPAGSVTVINSSEIRLSPFHGWRRLADMHRGYLELGDDLSAQEEEQLRAVERAIMLAPRQRRLVNRIDPGWIAPPLAFCARDPSWPYLEFGSPAFSGDFAFVWAEFQCVLCGQGTMLVLRRSAHGWRIVAGAIPWVS